MYFSNKTYAAARRFDRILNDFYKEINNSEKRLEVIFISGDVSETEFNEHFQGMQWVAVPFNDPRRLQLLGNNQKYPELKIVHSLSGEFVNSDGHRNIEDKGISAFEDWLVQANF